MSDSRPNQSRRKLLKYSGVGIAAALAGCNGDTGEDGQPDGETGPGQFELAGDGAAGFRRWLAPQFTLEPATDGQQRQLYQFIDYTRIPDGEMTQQVERRETFADQIGVEPTSIERELLLGPIESNLPYKLLFGSFDAERVRTAFENSGFERTSEPGDFVIYDEAFAISAEVIAEHPNSATLIDGAQNGYGPFEGYDEEMNLLLDLVPAGPQVTLNKRDDIDDVVLDGLTIFELNGPVATHSIRTLIFTDEEAASLDRAREIDIDGSVRDEVLTEEIDGRVVMLESQTA
jgi:hypothetical protein